MIKVSDYIVKRLEEYGVEQAFMIAGGGAMHLNDSFGRSEKISYLCNHHEQASGMAAEGYARASGKLPVVVVTSGPGGTNALTGVIGQWLDSVPCLYISGQVKQETMMRGGLRQLGDQEINIIDMVQPVTKYAAVVKDADDIGHMLDLALYLARSGRPGPVWLDVPLDIQAALIDMPGPGGYIEGCPYLHEEIAEVYTLLMQAKRPLLIAGHGIRIAGAQDLLMDLLDRTGMSVVTSFNGMDLVPSDHPAFMGRIGTIGTPAGNWALQNCDLLICVGTRNNIRQVSYDWHAFAPNATKVVVDIDAAELDKPTLRPDLAIQADAGAFLGALLEKLEGMPVPGHWWAWCRQRHDAETGRRWAAEIDPYHFIEVLTDLLPEDAVIVSGNGTASVCLQQAGKVKKGQRILMNSGCAAMGYDLPAAIGACLAVHPPRRQGEGRGEGGVRPVICITGDGSIQMNIQELATIAHHKLPIKIFVLNNGGYHSIRQTQDNYFQGRHVGAGPDSGVGCPYILNIAEAYGIIGRYIGARENGMAAIISQVLNEEASVICEVQLKSDYTFDKQSFAPSSLRGVSGLPGGVGV